MRVTASGVGVQHRAVAQLGRALVEGGQGSAAGPRLSAVPYWSSRSACRPGRCPSFPAASRTRTVSVVPALEASPRRSGFSTPVRCRSAGLSVRKRVALVRSSARRSNRRNRRWRLRPRQPGGRRQKGWPGSRARRVGASCCVSLDAGEPRVADREHVPVAEVEGGALIQAGAGGAVDRVDLGVRARAGGTPSRRRCCPGRP